MKKTIVFIFSLLFSLSAMSQEIPEALMQEIYEEVQSPYKYGMVVAPADNGHKID